MEESMTHRSKLLVRALAVVGLVAVLGGGLALAAGSSLKTILDDAHNEETKEAIQAEDDALIEYGDANPAPVPDNPENAGPSPDPADFERRTGIFENAEFPASMGVVFENRWQGQLDGWYVTVFAGGRSEKPEAGLLLIQLKDPETWGNKFEGPYEAPIAGPLRIESAKGSTLVVTGIDGETATFDLETRSFSR
jgi:type II secretory pathway pseudopilin PulG